MPNEFQRIAELFAPLTEHRPEAFGLTDDAALLPPLTAGEQWVVTKDAMAEHIHFIGDESPALIAKKLLRTNLSDLAAMGATPRHYLLAVMLPPTIDDDWLAAFAAGLAEDQQRFGVSLLGGDSIAVASDKLSFSLTALGAIKGTPLLRSGAQIGDVVCVSGSIGDAALGLADLQGRLDVRLSDTDKAFIRARYQLPEPRIALGKTLLGIAHAAMDMSDGLLADAAHMAAASNVAIELDADAIPLSKAGQSCWKAGRACQEIITGGGDDYELLFTLTEEKWALLQQCSSNVVCTVVGRVKAGHGVTIRDASGHPIDFQQQGWQH